MNNRSARVTAATGALLALGALLLPGQARAAALSSTAAPHVVELFTSQGCSSCPPAEALLGDIAKQGGVLALAYHVDYWDGQGWRDRYSLKEATTRQNDYAARMKLDYVYTPQMVIDGSAQLVGSDRKAVLTALAAPEHASVPLSLVRDGADIAIDIGSAQQGASARKGDLLLVAYQDGAETHVAGGENAGRTIAQVNIVRSIRSLGSWTGTARHIHMAAATLPAGSTRVALLLQEPGPGAILGAALLPLQ